MHTMDIRAMPILIHMVTLLLAIHTITIIPMLLSTIKLAAIRTAMLQLMVHTTTMSTIAILVILTIPLAMLLPIATSLITMPTIDVDAMIVGMILQMSPTMTVMTVSGTIQAVPRVTPGEVVLVTVRIVTTIALAAEPVRIEKRVGPANHERHSRSRAVTRSQGQHVT